MGDEEGIGEKGASQNAAGLEVAGCVGRGEGDEFLAEGFGQEDGSEGRAIFEVGGGGEGVGFRRAGGVWRRGWWARRWNGRFLWALDWL